VTEVRRISLPDGVRAAYDPAYGVTILYRVTNPGAPARLRETQVARRIPKRSPVWPLFEITLVLLAIAVVLLQIARHIPCALSSHAGAAAAGSGGIALRAALSIEPRLALALFVARPSWTPPSTCRREKCCASGCRHLARPWCCAADDGRVAWAGWRSRDCRWRPRWRFGRIVAPPDAAARRPCSGVQPAAPYDGGPCRARAC